MSKPALSTVLSEAIVDTVREPLILLDETLGVIQVNRSFCRAFDTSTAASVGRPFRELGDGLWDIATLLGKLEAIVSRGESFEDYEVARDFPGGGPRAMLLNARLLRQAESDAPLILLAVEDVTERRKFEALANDHAASLARSNRDLEEFAYVASHDLQEPLRMVVSYTQLLARRYTGKLDRDADEFIAYAVDGAKRMQRLISDLLDYSRLARKEVPLQPASAEEAFADALSALSAALADSGAKIEKDPLPAIRADQSQLIQLFQNLLGNALKFRSAVPLVIRVCAERDGAFWSFTVQDNGIGIDPQYFEKVFIIFERLHGVDVPGTGIGLALCRKIVQRHGGRIWIESPPAGGTALRFTLPAPKENQS